MISYLREILQLFNTTEWSFKQRELDTKLANHIPECPTEIAEYLLSLREHGRIQRERISNLKSVFDYGDTLRQINIENNEILGKLDVSLNSMEPCRHIGNLYKR
jgi:hypothetical protein